MKNAGFLIFFTIVFILYALIDLFHGITSLFGIFPTVLKDNIKRTNEITAAVVPAITFIVVLTGHINTWFPKVKELDLKIDKSAGRMDKLHIVVLSDIHLGTIIEKRHMKIIVDRVNKLNADIILIPGDIKRKKTHIIMFRAVSGDGGRPFVRSTDRRSFL